MQNKEPTELNKQIREYLDDHDDMWGYEIHPALMEYEKLLAPFGNIKSVYDGYLIIAEAYKKMGRSSLAASAYEKALDIALTLKIDDRLKDIFFEILRSRNHFIDDDCVEIYQKVKDSGLLDSEVLEKVYQDRMSRRRNLKADPIEMGEAYLAVIDEVEEKIKKNRKLFGMGSCHEYWNLKEEYLLEKGIRWKSPHIMNPRVMFD